MFHIEWDCLVHLLVYQYCLFASIVTELQNWAMINISVHVPYRMRLSCSEFYVHHGSNILEFLMRITYLRVFNSLESIRDNSDKVLCPYQLHQLMPSLVTCLVAKWLGNRFAENHWDLRDFTANLVASICKRWGSLFCSGTVYYLCVLEISLFYETSHVTNFWLVIHSFDIHINASLLLNHRLYVPVTAKL